jgi:hypothetical protein
MVMLEHIHLLRHVGAKLQYTGMTVQNARLERQAYVLRLRLEMASETDEKFDLIRAGV